MSEAMSLDSSDVFEDTTESIVEFVEKVFQFVYNINDIT
jgi:hypothetical protein